MRLPGKRLDLTRVWLSGRTFAKYPRGLRYDLEPDTPNKKGPAPGQDDSPLLPDSEPEFQVHRCPHTPPRAREHHADTNTHMPGSRRQSTVVNGVLSSAPTEEEAEAGA